jgi:hypothetical protein
MPQVNASLARLPLKINGVALTSPSAFAAGHTLTENEAKYLNRQVTTSVANPIPARIKEGAEGYKDLSAEQLQAKFDELYAAYELGAATRTGAPGEPVDPVERNLHRMAVDWVNGRLKAKGRNINEVKKATDASGASVYANLIKQAIAANPAWRALAEAQVAAMGETADQFDLDIGDIGLGSDTSPATGSDTTAGTDTVADTNPGVPTDNGAGADVVS